MCQHYGEIILNLNDDRKNSILFTDVHAVPRTVPGHRVNTQLIFTV